MRIYYSGLDKQKNYIKEIPVRSILRSFFYVHTVDKDNGFRLLSNEGKK